MEQKINFNQGLTTIWLIVITALITALVVAGAVYTWGKIINDKTQNDLQKQISDLQNQVAQPESQTTKLEKPGLFNTGNYIQITIAYECDNKYNIYRSLNLDSGFQKILQANYKRNPDGITCGGGSLVDMDYPKDAQKLYYKYVLLDNKESEVQESEVGTIDLETDLMTNWKTYRNEDYGIQFKYPEDKIIVVSERDINVWLRETYEFAQSEPGAATTPGISIWLLSYSYKIPREEISQAWLNNAVSPLYVLQTNKEMLDNKEVSVALGTETLNSNKLFIIPNSDKVLLISIQISSLYNQILSTFKFID